MLKILSVRSLSSVEMNVKKIGLKCEDFIEKDKG